MILKYSRDQLAGILNRRIDRGVRPGVVSDDIVDTIVDVSGNDARKAIDNLQRECRRGMHRRVEWMVADDDSILRLLAQSGLELSPSDLAHNLGYNRDYMAGRCREELVPRDLSRPAEGEGGPHYALTQRGRTYCDGDFRPAALE